MTPFDLKRLDSYANGALDYHVILDLVPSVASLYFGKRLGEDVKLSAVQSSVLLALGLQRKVVEDIAVWLYIVVATHILMAANFDLLGRTSASRQPSTGFV